MSKEQNLKLDDIKKEWIKMKKGLIRNIEDKEDES